MSDPALRAALFRFVDVVPACRSVDAVRLISDRGGSNSTLFNTFIGSVIKAVRAVTASPLVSSTRTPSPVCTTRRTGGLGLRVFDGYRPVRATKAMMEWAEPGATWLEKRSTRNFFGIGRLKDGVTVEQAQAQFDQIATELRQRFPTKQTRGLLSAF